MTQKSEHDERMDIADRREESIRVITEQMSELTNVIDNVKKDNAVNKDTAVSLEQIAPGILTDVCSLNGFTAAPSRTNVDLVLARATQRVEALRVSKEALVEEHDPFEIVVCQASLHDKSAEAAVALESIYMDLDAILQGSASLESLDSGRDISVLTGERNAIAAYLHPSIESLDIKTLDRESLAITMEGIWDALKENAKKIWEWIKGVIKKIGDWFSASTPEKRIQALDKLEESFKGDNDQYKLVLEEKDAKRLCVNNKFEANFIPFIEQYKKAIELFTDAQGVYAKAAASRLDILYKHIDSNGVEGWPAVVKEQKDIFVETIEKEINVQKLTAMFKTTKSSTGALYCHLLGSFILRAELINNGTSIHRFGIGGEDSTVGKQNLTIRGSDVEKIIAQFREIIKVGWGAESVKAHTDAKAILDTLSKRQESEFNKNRTGADDPKMKVLLSGKAQNEHHAVMALANLITTRASLLRKIESMETFIVRLCDRAKKGDKAKDKDKENKETA